MKSINHPWYIPILLDQTDFFFWTAHARRFGVDEHMQQVLFSINDGITLRAMWSRLPSPHGNVSNRKHCAYARSHHPRLPRAIILSSIEAVETNDGCLIY